MDFFIIFRHNFMALEHEYSPSREIASIPNLLYSKKFISWGNEFFTQSGFNA